MSTFLIQTVEDNIVHDFSFHLIEAIKYQNWFAGEEVHNYKFTDEKFSSLPIEDNVPIGSIEFVCDYIEHCCGFSPKPINVPIELFEHAGREIIDFEGQMIHTKETEFFVKSRDEFKCPTNGILKQKEFNQEGSWQYSGIIEEISSEYRLFIHNEKVVGIKHYLGDATIFPRESNLATMYAMIRELKGVFPVYTLDVGLFFDYEANTQVCVPIEVHEFFSCGLYGFQDYKILPQMFVRAYKNIIKRGF